jgi:hypothetical protein
MVDVERGDPVIADLGFPPDDHEVISRAAEGVDRQVHRLQRRTTYYRSGVCETGLGQGAFARAGAGDGLAVRP